MKNPYKCPKCGGEDLDYTTVEVAKFYYHVVNGEFISQKITPLEMQSEEFTCRECGHLFEYSELEEEN